MRIAFTLLIVVASVQIFAGEKLVVHEWGTFTSLQDESGRAVPGINADDEPLPKFVWSIAPDDYGQSNVFAKGLPRLHPQVTMRLETPVVYFYPPADAKLPIRLTFSAKFYGGMLTQFFPKADVGAVHPQRINGVVRIDPKNAGTLTWKDILVGTAGKPIETKERVWTAPREVQSAMLTAAGKSEKFLFYRGVANLNAPLVVTRENEKLHITVASDIHRPEDWPRANDMYLVEIRDGLCAFRQFADPMEAAKAPANITTPARFAAGDFSSGNLDQLRHAMHESLTRAGLKSDEATAMLNTWEQSYFKSPGMRLFFLVPESWTNAVLPISISQPAQITRVMVGRIEIATPQQREAIARIASAHAVDDAQATKAYEQLGRFRDALLLDALRVNPTAMLTQFTDARRIRFASAGEQK